MADVNIAYKGNAIAEMSERGTKTLQTAGTYCEGDISVEYAPRSRTYEITLAKSSDWVLLTELDDDVLAHIDDEDFSVLMVRLGAYSYDWYAGNCYFAGNTPIGYNGEYPVYGYSNRMTGETAVTVSQIYFTANNKSTAWLGGNGQFLLSGNQYSLRPSDGFIAAGSYRLTFQW